MQIVIINEFKDLESQQEHYNLNSQLKRNIFIKFSSFALLFSSYQFPFSTKIIYFVYQNFFQIWNNFFLCDKNVVGCHVSQLNEFN